MRGNAAGNKRTPAGVKAAPGHGARPAKRRGPARLAPALTTAWLCALALAGALAATAAAAPTSLTIDQSGTGSGGFECSVEGGSAEACEATYPTGTEVTVIATADAGSQFAEWSGECDAVEGSECDVTLDADKTVEAIFTAEQELYVAVTGAGSVDAAGGIEACREGSGECAAAYLEGTTVTLEAAPDAGDEFAGWTGCDSEPGGDCQVTMDADAGVTAEFAAIPPTPTHTLTVNQVGPGSGSVSCDGGACAPSYPEGTTLTLVATAGAGSSFVGWAGAGCSGTGACVVAMSSDLTVTAAFELLPPPPAPAAEEGQSKASPCAKPARRAQALAGRAKRLRRNARRLARNGNRGKARQLRRRAARFAKGARRQSNSAKRCRARVRRASR